MSGLKPATILEWSLDICTHIGPYNTDDTKSEMGIIRSHPIYLSFASNAALKVTYFSSEVYHSPVIKWPFLFDHMTADILFQLLIVMHATSCRNAMTMNYSLKTGRATEYDFLSKVFKRKSGSLLYFKMVFIIKSP